MTSTEEKARITASGNLADVTMQITEPSMRAFQNADLSTFRHSRNAGIMGNEIAIVE